MSTKQQIKLAVGVENNVGAGLKSALTDITKWNNEAARKLILRIAVDGRDAAKQASDAWINSVSKIQSRMKKFSFDGIFASKHFAKLTPTKIAFDETMIKNLDYTSAVDSLKQLRDLQSKINTGHAVSNTAWTQKEVNDLRNLIALLEQATGAYKRLKREENYLMGKNSWMENPLNQQLYAARQANQMAIHNSQMNKQRQTAQQRDERLALLNERIATAEKVIGKSSAKEQVDYNRELSKMYNERWMLTKKISDREKSLNYGDMARAQHQANQEAEKANKKAQRQQKEQERYESKKLKQDAARIAARSNSNGAAAAAYAANDKQMNRMVNGANSNQELARLRRAYKEEEKAAAAQKKASDAKLNADKKLRFRNTWDIDKSLDSQMRRVQKENEALSRQQYQQGRAWFKNVERQHKLSSGIQSEQQKEAERQLREDKKQRATENKLRRTELSAYRDSYAANDAHMNRMVTGGNSSQDLSRLRTYYKEQERIAASQAKAAAAQAKVAEAEEKARQKRIAQRSITGLAYEQAYRANDKQMNRMMNGGSSSQELANMRIFYREQEKQASAASREEQKRANIRSREAEKYARQLTQQSGLMRGLGSMARRYLNIFMIAGVVERISKMTGYFQQQQVALEGIIGSASKAQEVLNGAKSLALKSPFTTQQIVGNVKQIAAYGIPAEDLVPTTKMLGDLSAGLGVEMNRLILAYGQVKSASVLRGQELRQFTEAGVPMVQKLADKFTELNGRLVTTGDVFELISKRQVSFEMVAEVLKDMTSEGGQFYNMQENVMDTLYGQIGKLKDMWTLSLNDIGSTFGGLIMGIVKGLQTVIKNFAFVLGTLVFSSITRFLVVPFTTFFTTMKRSIKMLGVMKASMLGLRKVASSFSLISVAINAAWMALSLFIGHLVNARVKSKEFEKTISSIESTFSKDTTKMINGLNSLIGKIESLPQTSKKYGEAVKTLLANYSDYIDEDMVNDIEKKTVEERAKAWKELADSINLAIQARKDYERKESIQQTSGEKAVENTIDKIVENLALNQSDEFAVYDATGSASYTRIFNELGRALQKSNVKSALEASLTQMYTGGYTETEKLQEFIKTQARSYGLTQEVTDELANNAQTILDILGKTEEWKRYLQETEALMNDSHSIVKQKFELASNEIADKGYGIKQSDDVYINAVVEGLNSLGVSSRSVSEILKKDWTASKTHEVADALHELAKATGDKQLKENINSLRRMFIDIAGTRTGVAADIATKLENRPYGKEFRDFASDFIPTDETLEQVREKIRSRYDSNIKEIEDHSSDASEAWKEHLKVLKKENENLKILASADLFDINLDKKKKSGSNKGPSERPEFFNLFKGAYDLYKKATEGAGVSAGINFVKTDKNAQELYGNLFGGTEGEKAATKQLKIGNKSIGDIIKEHLITDGLETGIVDFRAAAEATAKELRAYYEGNKDKRKAYLTAADQLDKWISETFANDSLTKYLRDLESAVKDVTIKFDGIAKSSELYEKLYKNGMYSLAGSTALSFGNANPLLPKSVVSRNKVNSILDAYNANGGNASIGDIDTLADINNVLQKLNDKDWLNNNGFAAGSVGEKVANELISALQKLASDVESEMGELTSLKITGDGLEDSILKANQDYKTAKIIFKKASALNAEWGASDYSANKSLADSYSQYATEVFDAFMKQLDLKNLSMGKKGVGMVGVDMSKLDAMLKELTGRLPKEIADEIMNKRDDLVRAVGEYNSKIGSLSAFGNAFHKYKGADDSAKAEYDMLDNAIKTGGYTNSNGAYIHLTEAELMNYRKRREEIGKDGSKLAASIKADALKEMTDAMETAQKELNVYSEALNSVIAALKSFNDAVYNMYDALSDGENPEWMQQMNDFLGDWADNFQALIAPISAVIGMVSALTAAFTALDIAAAPLLIIVAAVVAAAAVIAGIVAAVQAHDKKLSREIETLENDIKHLNDSISNLQSSADRTYGTKKFMLQMEAMSKQIEIMNDALAEADKELKKNNTDWESYHDYTQKAEDALNSFYDELKSMRDGITGSVDTWADAMSNSLRSAFQNGENAARSLRDTVNTMMGDIVENMIKTTVLEPAIESAINNFLGGSVEDIKEKYTTTDKEGKKHFDYNEYNKYIKTIFDSDDKINQLGAEVTQAGTDTMNFIEAISSYLQDVYKYSSDSASLGGGIKAVTEETARRIEALSNSQLGELYRIDTQIATITADTAVMKTNVIAIRSAIESVMDGGIRRMQVTMS